jgi:hypothetical protein
MQDSIFTGVFSYGGRSAAIYHHPESDTLTYRAIGRDDLTVKRSTLGNAVTERVEQWLKGT